MTETSASPQTESRLIRRGVAWKLSAGLVGHALRIAIALVLARLLTPHEYGIAGMALVVSGFVIAFSDLGLGAALVQRRTITERDRSTTFWICVAAGLLFTAVGVAGSGLAAAAFGQPEAKDLFVVMSLTFLVTSLGSTQAALLSRSMSFKTLELRVIAGTVVGGAVGIGVAVAGGGAWAIVAQQVVISVVSTTLLWIATPWRPRFMISLESLRALGAYSANVIGNRVAYVAQDTATPLLIGRFLGPTSLGLYAVANNVALIPISRITQPLGEVLFPAFSRQQSDRARIGELWLTAMALSAAVAVPALAGLAVVAPDFVETALGSKWEAVVPILQTMSWVAAMRALQGPTTSVVLGIGRADALFRFSVVYLFVSVASVAVGIPWGIEGVAVMLAVTATTFGAVWIVFVGRQVEVSVTQIWKALGGVVQATLLMMAAVIGTRYALLALGAPATGRLVVCVAVGIASYGVACYWRAPAVFERLWSPVEKLGLRRFGARLASPSPRTPS